MAVAQAQYFGLVGHGAISVLSVEQHGIGVFREFRTPDATFDVCWSEANQSHLLSASGDGCLRLWDTMGAAQEPLVQVKAHEAEI